MFNVLVFPCGSEIGLEIHNALKYDKHVKLIGLSSLPSHGRVVYKNYIEGISFYNSDTFIDELNEIIENNDIDLLIPAYDDIILFLSENRDLINCKLITSSRETCDICRSKAKTYDYLKGESFIPKVYDINDIIEDELPLFAKPDIGQGSQGVKRIDHISDLEEIKSSDTRYIVTELLPGKEYTVDCFTNSNGELVFASMRERIRIKMGISVNSSAQKTPDDVLEIANIINRKIRFDGVWFFQLKVDNEGGFKLLEIAPRVAGSMATSRMRGFNFILNSVYQAMGYQVKAIPNLLDRVEISRALSCVYSLDLEYDYVYIDFDDTMTLRSEINIWTMAFLFQCVNQRKKIILLTRHAGVIMKTLERYHIAADLFEKIVNVEDKKAKSDYIEHTNAIFIDDSFRERYDVSEKKGIPVFDVDGIDALLNWRI